MNLNWHVDITGTVGAKRGFISHNGEDCSFDDGNITPTGTSVSENAVNFDFAEDFHIEQSIIVQGNGELYDTVSYHGGIQSSGFNGGTRITWDLPVDSAYSQFIFVDI